MRLTLRYRKIKISNVYKSTQVLTNTNDVCNSGIRCIQTERGNFSYITIVLKIAVYLD